MAPVASECRIVFSKYRNRNTYDSANACTISGSFCRLTRTLHGTSSMSSTLSKPYQAQQSKSLEHLSLHLLNMLLRCLGASNHMHDSRRGLTAKGNNRSRSTQRRVSRACDECYHRRVKCDGQKPCEHCTGK
jgi:hypothetical protein